MQSFIKQLSASKIYFLLFSVLLAVPLLLLSKLAYSSEINSQQQQQQQTYPFNKAYPIEDIKTPLSWVDTKAAMSAVSLHRGLLFVPLGYDHGGGQGKGAFAIYNVDDPTKPSNIFDTRDYPEIYHSKDSKHYVGDFSEAHGISFHNDLVVMAERGFDSAGFSILDLAPLFDNDPNTLPKIISRFAFPGLTKPTSYDGYSFSPVWQGGRYVYAATGSYGLFVVDTSDVTAPRLISHLPKAKLYNQALRSAHVIGDLLILSPVGIASNDQSMVFVDVSKPNAPTVLNKHKISIGYQGFVYGGHFYGGGTRDNKKEKTSTGKLTSKIIRYDFSNVHDIKEEVLATTTRLKKPEYGYVVDDNLFLGHYPGLSKWQMKNGKATHVTDIEPMFPVADDYAFISPMGNLAAVTSDHNVQSRLNIGVHDREADIKGPDLRYILPKNKQINVPRTAKIGISFSDFIDPISLSTASLQLKKIGSDKIIDSDYGHLAGIVNIVPKQPLDANSHYEVLVVANKLTDQVGNFFEGEHRLSQFSTGDTLADFNVSIRTEKPLELGSITNFNADLVTTDKSLELEYSWQFSDSIKENIKGNQFTPFSASPKISYTYKNVGNHTVTLRTRVKGKAVEQKTTEIQVIYPASLEFSPKQSSTLAFDAKLQRLYVVNPDNNTVTAISDKTLDKVYEVPVGKTPSSVALYNDQIWVTNKKDDSISILASDSGVVLNTINLDYGSAPHGIIILPKQHKAYVVLTGSSKVIEIDTRSKVLTKSTSVGNNIRYIGYDAKHQQLILPNYRAAGVQGNKVNFIDLVSMQVISSKELSASLNDDSLNNGQGTPNYLGAMAINPSFNDVWLPGKKDNMLRGSKRNGEPLTFDHTVRSMAANIDLTSHQENLNNRIDFDNSDMATAALYSPFANMAYFTTLGSSTVWVIDAFDQANRYSFDSEGLAPISLIVNSQNNHLYIHNFMSRTVTVFNSSKNNIGDGDIFFNKSIPLVDKEVLTKPILAGKKAFYDSRSAGLSQEGYMSCASCHIDGSHDGRVWDLTSMGEGLRNTIDLRGRAGLEHGPLHWTANFDEVQDFEIQIRQLNQGLGLIQGHKYDNKVKPSYGKPKKDLSQTLDQLAAYVSSLTDYPQTPYRVSSTELTDDAVQGRQVFVEQGCHRCHRGPHFTDSTINRLHNVGTINDSGQRLGKELTGFDTPTLIGLWQSAPYLHNGSAETIMDAVGQHNNLSSLSKSEKHQLNEFLLQLSTQDQIMAEDVKTNSPANKAPSFAQTEYSFEVINEVQYKNVFAHVQANDEDSAQQLSYYLIAGQDSGFFNINKDDGGLYFKGDMTSDKSQYTFKVMVEDNGNFIEQSVADITVIKSFSLPKPVTELSVKRLDDNRIQLTWPHNVYAEQYTLYKGLEENKLYRGGMIKASPKVKRTKVVTKIVHAPAGKKLVIRVDAENNKAQGNGKVEGKRFTFDK